MLRYFNDFTLLFKYIKNPLPLILDRLSVLKHAYMVTLKNCLALEIRPGCGDRYGLYEVLLRGDYTKYGQEILKGDTVIDVGANIGCFTILAAKIVGPSGRVFALEPEDKSFIQLKRNIEVNNLKNVVPLRVALSSREGVANLHTSDRSSLFSSLFNSVDGKEIQTNMQKVIMTTLEGLMKKESISTCNYLKMDCEGAEYEIIKNMSSEISKRIDQVSMEIHTIPNHNSYEIIQKLDALGFKIVNKRHIYFFRR
jgi:FkbM family methyltransferase